MRREKLSGKPSYEANRYALRALDVLCVAMYALCGTCSRLSFSSY